MLGIRRPSPRLYSSTESVKRFTAVAQILHWLTAALMIIVVVIAWHMTMYPKSDQSRETWYYTHESIGVTILALTVVRLVWRHYNPPPHAPGRLSAVEHWIAVASHWALYAILVIMPLSGYCIASGTGHHLPYFFLFSIPPLLPTNHAVAGFGQLLHWYGQWFVYGLFALHLLATCWHVAILRDGLLDRMLPIQDGATVDERGPS